MDPHEENVWISWNRLMLAHTGFHYMHSLHYQRVSWSTDEAEAGYLLIYLQTGLFLSHRSHNRCTSVPFGQNICRSVSDGLEMQTGPTGRSPSPVSAACHTSCGSQDLAGQVILFSETWLNSEQFSHVSLSFFRVTALFSHSQLDKLEFENHGKLQRAEAQNTVVLHQ